MKPTATDLFTNGARFTDLSSWRSEIVELHAHGPVHRIEQPGYEPFWAVIGVEEIRQVEGDAATFTNQPNPVLHPGSRYGGAGLETLIHLDPPRHTAQRRVTADWFKPSALRDWEARIDTIVRQALDGLHGATQCDFASQVAVPIPLQVILEIFGLPERDYAGVLRFTRAMFGTGDPSAPPPPIPPGPDLDPIRYFRELAESRQAQPCDDLASTIANGTADGRPLTELEILSYYVIIVTAGHDTTSSAMAGGLDALLEHPHELKRLRRDPELLTNAVEEMLRWTAPVRHFMRTASGDTEIAGTSIAAGDWVYLSYLGANMDPRTFENPLRFDVTRDNADRHVAFGHGRHHCLGAGLARIELRALFSELLARTSSIERNGPSRTDRTTFVGGHSSVPIRYELHR
ncbi:MAG: cytochrome P450 [Actinomycetota bacterium]